jgi:hypothetical protein
LSGWVNFELDTQSKGNPSNIPKKDENKYPYERESKVEGHKNFGDFHLTPLEGKTELCEN